MARRPAPAERLPDPRADLALIDRSVDDIFRCYRRLDLRSSTISACAGSTADARSSSTHWSSAAGAAPGPDSDRGWLRTCPALDSRITSSRTDEGRLGLFDAPILAGGALDRLAKASYQIETEDESCRRPPSLHRALLEHKEVLDPPTTH